MPYDNGHEPDAGARLPAELSIQELHLELIRRASFNLFDGERVVADLVGHRALWRAVIFDTYALSMGGGLSSLIKLRDMADNFYNVDTLYILAVHETAAKRLAEFAEPWLADTVDIAGRSRTNRLLGGCYGQLRLVTMWWD